MGLLSLRALAERLGSAEATTALTGAAQQVVSVAAASHEARQLAYDVLQSHGKADEPRPKTGWKQRVRPFGALGRHLFPLLVLGATAAAIVSPRGAGGSPSPAPWPSTGEPSNFFWILAISQGGPILRAFVVLSFGALDGACRRFVHRVNASDGGPPRMGLNLQVGPSRVATSARPERSPRSPTVLLICSWFLGWLGVDRFYLGHWNWGLIKACPVLVLILTSVFPQAFHGEDAPLLFAVLLGALFLYGRATAARGARTVRVIASIAAACVALALVTTFGLGGRVWFTIGLILNAAGMWFADLARAVSGSLLDARGRPLGAKFIHGTPVKSRRTAALLSYFLGLVGADRFYLGYNQIALLKLVTAGGLGVWALVDVFRIGTGRMRDSQGNSLVDALADSSTELPAPRAKRASKRKRRPDSRKAA